MQYTVINDFIERGSLKLIKAGDTEEVKGDSSLENVFLELENDKEENL